MLRTPTHAERRTAGAAFERLAERLPGWSYRWRWPLVAGALGLSLLGAVSLFGLPGVRRSHGHPHGPRRVHRSRHPALPRHPAPGAADARALRDASLVPGPPRCRRRAGGADGAAPLPAGPRGRSPGRSRDRSDLDPAPGALPGGRRRPLAGGSRRAGGARRPSSRRCCPWSPCSPTSSSPTASRRRRSRWCRPPPSTRPS